MKELRIKDMKKKIENNKLTIYLGTILFFSAIYYLLCLFSRGNLFDSVFFGDHNDTFADFFKCVYGWNSNPYLEGYCNYPALATMMFKLCHHFIPSDEGITNGLFYRNVSQIWIVFILYNIFCIWLCSVSISCKLKLSKLNSALLSLVLLISFPVMFSFERGNQINLAFAFTIFFACFYDSENKVLRELSYILLAIAAVLKIYPAIYGFILVNNKKWKDAVRLTIYGLLFFFVPFLYYGKTSLLMFIKSLMNFSANQGTRFAYNFSLSNITRCVFTMAKINISDWAIYFIDFLIVALVIYAFFLVKQKWGKMLCITLLMIWIPNVSDAYVLIFLIIPFTFFIGDIAAGQCDQFNKIELIGYMILFAILFIPLALPVIQEYTYTSNYLMTYAYLVYFIDIVALGVFFSVMEINRTIKKRNLKYGIVETNRENS